MADQIPFSPLTHHELNERAVGHSHEIGVIVRARYVYEGDLDFDDYERDALTRHAAGYAEYHGAAMARMGLSR